VRKVLFPVELELAGDEHGQRAGGGGGGPQPGEHRLRLQRVGEFDNVGGLRAGQHGRGDGREDREHGRRVHQTPLAHR
jgi:hypothetical protein